MSKDYNVFGGWLKVFQGYNVFFIVGEIVFSVFIIKNMQSVPDAIPARIFFVFDAVAACFFALWLIKGVTHQSGDTPNKMVKILLWSLYANVGLITLGYLSGYFLSVPEGLNITAKDAMKVIGKAAMPFVFWSAYFKQSDRVKAYYGQNANLPFL